jgi:hypothetical protein
MKPFTRLGRVFGFGILGVLVATAGPHIAPRMGLQSAEAAAPPPLAGTWLPVQANAPITSLHITVQTAFNVTTNTVENRYVVNAAGRHGDMGVATTPVPPGADDQITVTFHTEPCQPITPHCIPTFLPSTTSLTMAQVGICPHACPTLVVKFITRSAAGRQTGGEYMNRVS